MQRECTLLKEMNSESFIMAPTVPSLQINNKNINTCQTPTGTSENCLISNSYYSLLLILNSNNFQGFQITVFSALPWNGQQLSLDMYAKHAFCSLVQPFELWKAFWICTLRLSCCFYHQSWRSGKLASRISLIASKIQSKTILHFGIIVIFVSTSK